MTWSLLVVAVAAFGVSILAPFAFRPLLISWAVVDVPSSRSSHSTTTLRAGGLGPLTGCIVGLGLTAVALPHDFLPLVVIGAVMLALAAVGFLDDLRDLPAVPRLGAQILVGATAGLVIALATGTYAWWVALPVVAVLIVGYVNAANFMDGINALSGLHGAVVGVAFVCSGLLTDTDWLSYVGGVIAAAFIAFLPWNLQRSGFFLGDVGSYALGGVIAVTASFAIGIGLPPLLILAPLAVYIADTSATMVRRLVSGEKVTSPHRTHAYQRLSDIGLSHLTAAIVVSTTAAVNTVIAAVAAVTAVNPWVALLGIVLVCVVYLTIPRWRGSRVTLASFVVPEAALPRSLPPSIDRSVRRWAVLGASGFVGSAVVAGLRKRGYEAIQVRAPRLSVASSVAIDTDGLLDEASRAEELGSLVSTLRGIDVVVNAAGLAAPDAGASDELYGANALLPVVIAQAAHKASVGRFVHLSSAAVQGRRTTVDATVDAAPHSPYAHSKTLGERGLLAQASRADTNSVVILRATSVQGADRPTTERLIRLAHSPLASVAAPGESPSVVSSITRLVDTIIDIGETASTVPGIVLQPWEGLSARRVLELASGGRSPRTLPAFACRIMISLGFAVGRVLPRFTGITRRIEVLWFGQGQAPGWRQDPGTEESPDLLNILDPRRAR